VIVSSGAIGVGCLRLGLKERPSAIAQKQALAAVGQVHLMRYYEDFFSAVGLVRIPWTAQPQSAMTSSVVRSSVTSELPALRYRIQPDRRKARCCPICYMYGLPIATTPNNSRHQMP